MFESHNCGTWNLKQNLDLVIFSVSLYITSHMMPDKQESLLRNKESSQVIPNHINENNNVGPLEQTHLNHVTLQKLV